jgi:hypothetical protein
MILKAGTYTFNTIPYIQSRTKSFIGQENFNYTAHYDDEYSSECTYMVFGIYETDEMSPGEYYPMIDTDAEGAYDGGVWSFGVPLKVTTTVDQDVSEEFYTVFTASTDYNAVNGISLNVLGWRKLKSDYTFMMTSPVTTNIYPPLENLGFTIQEYNGIDKLTCIISIPTSAPTYWLEAIVGINTDGSEVGYLQNAYNSDEDFNDLIEMLTTTPFKVLSTDSSTVDYWLSEYTEAVDVATHIAEITYNGETIAQLNAGETATLPCKDNKMASDVVVKVNEGESKIPEGYIKPEGSLPITENGTYNVTDKEEVVVNVPEPSPTIPEIETEAEMNALLDTSAVGNIYKYIGVSGTYQNGAWYLVQRG